MASKRMNEKPKEPSPEEAAAVIAAARQKRAEEATAQVNAVLQEKRCRMVGSLRFVDGAPPQFEYAIVPLE